MHHASQLAPGAIYKGEKPVRNPLYLRFVRRFLCAACGGARDIGPCPSGPHAFGHKDDRLVIPICRLGRRGFDNDPRAFVPLHA